MSDGLLRPGLQSLSANLCHSVTVVSILRLQSLIYFAKSTNPTWDQWIVAWWSTIEVNVGMICTCLPAVRLILVRACPRIFSTNQSRYRSTASATDDGYGRGSRMLIHKHVELSSVETTNLDDDARRFPTWSHRSDMP